MRGNTHGIIMVQPDGKPDHQTTHNGWRRRLFAKQGMNGRRRGRENGKMENGEMENGSIGYGTYPPPGPSLEPLHCNAEARGLTLNRTTNSSDTATIVNDESPLSRPPRLHRFMPPTAGREKKKGQSTKKSPKPTLERQNPAGRDSWENLPSTRRRRKCPRPRDPRHMP